MPALFTHICDIESCADPAVLLDCDGVEVPTVTDAQNNPVVVLCDPTPPTVTEYDSTVGEPPSNCVEGVYYDTVDECVTHICISGVLQNVCGV